MQITYQRRRSSASWFVEAALVFLVIFLGVGFGAPWWIVLPLIAAVVLLTKRVVR